MSNFRFHLLFVLFTAITLNCTPDDDKYQRIVNKSWIQDSSHSLLTVYSFEFEDYVGKSFGEFLTDYPDSMSYQHFIEDPICILRGWSFRYADYFEVQVIFNYDTHSDVIRRDTLSMAEWNMAEYLDQQVLRFEVYDFTNYNTIVPRKYDKLNREVED